ncbi:MAG TPA: hypothetical protein VH062_23265 [Polyangiaceae bacterium]|jgi:hypothetical protein|nr:hypothetical protein [Polyangiaceae bacterium]
MTMRSMLVFLGLFTVSGCSPDARSCTDVGCEDGVVVVMSSGEDAGSGPLPDGTYLVAVTADGARSTATCTVNVGKPDCVGAAGPLLFFSSGSDIEVHVGTRSKAVGIDVTRNGVALMSQTVAPAYHDVSPNGAGCSPTCAEATVHVGL